MSLVRAFLFLLEPLRSGRPGRAALAIGCGLAAAAVGAAVGACGDATTSVDLSSDAALDAFGAGAAEAAHDGGAPSDPTDSAPGDGDGSVVIAVIGDYGVCSQADPLQYAVTCSHEQAVAAQVHSWRARAIVTTGDNSYGSGRADQIAGDQAPYDVDIDGGRFFPSMGNHDWLSGGIEPSLTYFGLSSPIYSKAFDGVVTFYILDTNDGDDAGITADSAQARWLARQLAASTTPWNIVVNHEAPHSSCGEGSYDGSGGREDLRWIAATGVDAVLSGHSHVYERLTAPNFAATKAIPFVVVGTSGAPLQQRCNVVLPGQQTAIYGEFGALRLVASRTTLAVSFVREDGAVRDTLTLSR